MNLSADNTAIVLDSTADFPDAHERFESWRKLQRELGRLERRLDARARSEHSQQIRKEARQRRRTQRSPRGRAR